jgi:glucosamine kinase
MRAGARHKTTSTPTTKEAAMFYLGVDAGGTHCRAQLINEEGILVGFGEGGPGNTRLGIDASFASIEQSFRQACQRAQLESHQLTQIAAGLGVAGVERDGAKEKLRTCPFPFNTVEIASDVEIANLGAHSGQDGAVVIVGTGSIGFARCKGETFRVGGYGFPISDEGSGAYLGLQALRVTLRAADGRISGTNFTENLFGDFDASSRKIVAWMDEAGATEYATLAPKVVEYARQGDKIAADLMRRAAEHVNAMVESLSDWGAPQCSIIGGLSEHIIDWLPHRTASNIKPPEGQPIDGAILLAKTLTTTNRLAPSKQ